MGSCLSELLSEAKNTIFFSVKALFFKHKTFGASLEESAKKDFPVLKLFEIPDLG